MMYFLLKAVRVYYSTVLKVDLLPMWDWSDLHQCVGTAVQLKDL